MSYIWNLQKENTFGDVGIVTKARCNM